MKESKRWPSIPVADWQDTRDTLQLCAQVVGKVRLANEPQINHWWNVPLYVSATGLTTSLMPHPTGPAFQIDFDFIEHRLDIATVTGERRSLALVPRPVAEFYEATMSLLAGLGVATDIWPMPVEIIDAIAFPDDRVHASYDAAAVRRFWLALVQMERVLKVFRSRFVGKASPVHLFWGALDLAHTRFSGRTAPPHPGGAPNCGPHVMWEAYSHEVSSCGYWPGLPGEEGVFYAYAYPEPPSYRDAQVLPAGARWDEGLSEFILPYEIVRTAENPDAVLLAFLQSTYDAAAATARWDRDALERQSGTDRHDGHMHPPRHHRRRHPFQRWMRGLCAHRGPLGRPSTLHGMRARRLLQQLLEPSRHRPLARTPEHHSFARTNPGEDWWWCYPRRTLLRHRGRTTVAITPVTEDHT